MGFEGRSGSRRQVGVECRSRSEGFNDVEVANDGGLECFTLSIGDV